MPFSTLFFSLLQLVLILFDHFFAGLSEHELEELLLAAPPAAELDELHKMSRDAFSFMLLIFLAITADNNGLALATASQRRICVQYVCIWVSGLAPKILEGVVIYAFFMIC